MPPVGFEPTISVGKRPHTYALDRAATGTGIYIYIYIYIYELLRSNDENLQKLEQFIVLMLPKLVPYKAAMCHHHVKCNELTNSLTNSPTKCL